MCLQKLVRGVAARPICSTSGLVSQALKAMAVDEIEVDAPTSSQSGHKGAARLLLPRPQRSQQGFTRGLQDATKTGVSGRCYRRAHNLVPSGPGGE